METKRCSKCGAEESPNIVIRVVRDGVLSCWNCWYGNRENQRTHCVDEMPPLNRDEEVIL